MTNNEECTKTRTQIQGDFKACDYDLLEFFGRLSGYSLENSFKRIMNELAKIQERLDKLEKKDTHND